MAALRTNNLVHLGRQHTRIAGVLYEGRRHEGTGVVRSQTSNLAAYRRGRGGRSSFSGLVVTVLGASGYTGKHIVNKLGKIGSQVIVPYRGDPYNVKDLKLAGDLGQVLFQPYHLQDEDSLRRAMQYSNVVINLVGRDYATKNFSLELVNIKGAQRIGKIAREMGVEKLIHFSHLNANPFPEPIYLKNGSEYLRTKYHGEMALREEFPDAIVFRPSDIYGGADRFLRYYSNSWRRMVGFIPLWKKGEKTIKMPVYITDVAQGVINAIHDQEAIGKTYDVVGPHSYMLSELIDYMYRIMRKEYYTRTYITPAFKLKVMYTSNFPNYPICTMDKLSREHVSDQTNHLPTLEELGLTPTRIENKAPYELSIFRRNMHYEEELGEYPEPDPPVVLT